MHLSELFGKLFVPIVHVGRMHVVEACLPCNSVPFRRRSCQSRCRSSIGSGLEALSELLQLPCVLLLHLLHCRECPLQGRNSQRALGSLLHRLLSELARSCHTLLHISHRLLMTAHLARDALEIVVHLGDGGKQVLPILLQVGVLLLERDVRLVDCIKAFLLRCTEAALNLKHALGNSVDLASVGKLSLLMRLPQRCDVAYASFELAGKDCHGKRIFHVDVVSVSWLLRSGSCVARPPS